MADETNIVRVPSYMRARMAAHRVGQAAVGHLGGMEVVKTAAQLGVGFVGARAVSYYVEKSGTLDKTITDPKNRGYARAGGLMAIGAVMVLKTQKARVVGMGVILEGLAELIIPTVESTVDDQIAASNNTPQDLAGGGQGSLPGSSGQAANAA